MTAVCGEVITSTGGVEHCHVFEDMIHAPEVPEVRRGNNIRVFRVIAVHLPNQHQAICIGKSESPQNRDVHHTKDHGVGCDPQRECQDRSHSEAGVLDEVTNGVP